ncbi:hypothetical protein P153DRAFT_427004 [Dothidotthia symphoricarpi CBS 119687]|uniref:Uncharacterized protein n=1 Tax=Dothidotthia symphoricarpi CBS 119687 TaxID=1392245 RepID=A0A6A5ZXG8_9PLEO|nr:uncharacterized protein P153DRAFT_427004 [Dothidotthia symphoricarpi CBS 119687]KAF2123467.1 hypothetical protein P153DRAFT_427004 [Dothidotthia symphoricarpi CBS 119687]
MTDRFKNLTKDLHRPKLGGGSGSSGGQSDSKFGQVKGLLSRGKSSSDTSREHQTTPLSSLKDPSSFAPPPRRGNYGVDSVGSVSSRPVPAPPPRSTGHHLQEREEEASKAPPVPYRADTTGLNTAHLPKPPAFRPNSAAPTPPTSSARPKPSLPPRLPPRQNSNPDEYAPAPPPTYNEATQEGTPLQGMLNQGAMGRLGQAGISVPGFGIGRTASPPVPARHNPSPPVPPRQNSHSSIAPPPPPASKGQGSQLSELQGRFARMSTQSAEPQAPSTGTSWADKQAALRTASSLRNDPSKVSVSDLKGAASTANNFQQRHGEQAASGWRAANGLNQKYGIADRVNNLGSSSTSPAPGVGKKPPPPPPPAKKKELSGSSGEPPPIPLSSKPKFT